MLLLVLILVSQLQSALFDKNAKEFLPDRPTLNPIVCARNLLAKLDQDIANQITNLTNQSAALASCLNHGEMEAIMQNLPIQKKRAVLRVMTEMDQYCKSFSIIESNSQKILDTYKQQAEQKQYELTMQINALQEALSSSLGENCNN